MATYTTNYNLTKPTFSELADVRAINGNMDTIDDVMNASQNSIAPPYDSTESYSEGDMVMYELYLYKCLEETTGTWDATKWERAYSASSGAELVYPQDATKYLNGMGQWAVPAGGGGGVNYSTTEQVIGTWIDGSTIYQTTVSNVLSLTSSWQNYFPSANIDTIISVEPRIRRTGEEVPSAFSPSNVASWVNRDGYIKVCIQGGETDWEITSMTISYTKVTV